MTSFFQHGFQARRSTVTNLLSVTHFLQVNLDARKQIDVIYMDFSKAFDHVDHKLLLTKLDSFGFSDNLIQLIASYLSDRALFVQYRGFSSGLFQQLSGVPQGSVLGPLFFVIFSNDMTDLLDVPFQLYADDLKIYNVIETNEDCLKLQRNIDLTRNWARTNNLLLNINKCNVVSYSRRTLLSGSTTRLKIRHYSVLMSLKIWELCSIPNLHFGVTLNMFCLKRINLWASSYEMGNYLIIHKLSFVSIKRM
jgi:hypothetical protein